MVPGPITTLADPDDPDSRPSFMPSVRSRVVVRRGLEQERRPGVSPFEKQPTYTPFPRTYLRLDFATGRFLSKEPSPYLVMAPSDPRFRPVSRVVVKDLPSSCCGCDAVSSGVGNAGSATGWLDEAGRSDGPGLRQGRTKLRAVASQSRSSRPPT